jgi:hypothetical protein
MTLERAKVGLLALAVIFLGIIAWQGSGYRTVGGDVTLDPGSTVGISGPVTLAPDTTVGINGAVPVTVASPLPVTLGSDPLPVTLGKGPLSVVMATNPFPYPLATTTPVVPATVGSGAFQCKVLLEASDPSGPPPYLDSGTIDCAP